MTTIKLGERELKIKYGFEATVKSGIIRKLASLGSDNEDGVESITKTLEILPELILAGVQKYHSDEFGYNYKTEEGKEEALSKIYSLVDDYFDGEDADFGEILDTLQNELMENGFLAKMLREEIAEQKTEEKKSR